MAAAYLPAPGTEYGPCEGECEHTDCAQLRGYYAAPCGLCGEPIGWETGFFSSRLANRLPRGDDHAKCAHRLTEVEQAHPDWPEPPTDALIEELFG